MPLRVSAVDKVCDWLISVDAPSSSTGELQSTVSPGAQPIEEIQKDDEETDRSSDAERGQVEGAEGASPLIKQKGDSKESRQQKKHIMDLRCGNIPCQFEVGLYEYNPK